MSAPGTFQMVDGTAVSMKVAKVGWTAAARPVLEVVAGTYRATIRYAELAEQLQVATGVRTKTLMHHWIGGVLAGVSEDCRSRGEPLLPSLCVDNSGSVGPGYAQSVEGLDGVAPADPDMHAADERFACYRHFGAELPADGGRSALTSQVYDSRLRAARQAEKLRPRPVCPTCFISMPLSGVCGNCV